MTAFDKFKEFVEGAIDKTTEIISVYKTLSGVPTNVKIAVTKKIDKEIKGVIDDIQNIIKKDDISEDEVNEVIKDIENINVALSEVQKETSLSKPTVLATKKITNTSNAHVNYSAKLYRQDKIQVSIDIRDGR